MNGSTLLRVGFQLLEHRPRFQASRTLPLKPADGLPSHPQAPRSLGEFLKTPIMVLPIFDFVLIIPRYFYHWFVYIALYNFSLVSCQLFAGSSGLNCKNFLELNKFISVLLHVGATAIQATRVEIASKFWPLFWCRVRVKKRKRKTI